MSRRFDRSSKRAEYEDKRKHDPKRRAAMVRVSAGRQKANRLMLADIKVKSGCMRCGFNEHPAALEFHHRDPASKVFTLARAHSSSLATVMAEVAKCDVLCANCHRIHTALQKEHLSAYNPVKAEYLASLGLQKARVKTPKLFD